MSEIPKDLREEAVEFSPDVYEDAEGKWKVRDNNKKHLTPRSRLGIMAPNLNERHQEGWKFRPELKTSRGVVLGRVLYRVLDHPDNKQ